MVVKVSLIEKVTFQERLGRGLRKADQAEFEKAMAEPLRQQCAQHVQGLAQRPVWAEQS